MDSSKANANLVRIKIGGTVYLGTASIGTPTGKIPITSAETGETVLGHIVNKTSFPLTLRLRTTDEPTRKLLMGYDNSGVAPVEGSHVTGLAVVLEDPAAADNSKSLIFPNWQIREGPTEDATGQGLREFVCVGEACPTSDAPAWSVGDPDA